MASTPPSPGQTDKHDDLPRACLRRTTTAHLPGPLGWLRQPKSADAGRGGCSAGFGACAGELDYHGTPAVPRFLHDEHGPRLVREELLRQLQLRGPRNADVADGP